MPELHRTNIILHASDVAYFQSRYGYGWTEKVRDIIHDWVRTKNAIGPAYTESANSKFSGSELDELLKEQSDD